MPNRLAQSQSLYLRKHANNPIDWWPWCDEALDKAQQENKPIFLSIGYSSCHWCTVMEGEAFSDPTIAEYMNTHFVPIKVDREERPDIDSIYMQALQLMTGQGGWPLNVFLSPDDRLPFYGGTYFPVDPKYGRPGFMQILQGIRRVFDSDTAKVASVKAEIIGRLRQALILESDEEFTGDRLQQQLRQGLQSSADILMPRGMGPSFPMIPHAEAALRATRWSLSEERPEAQVNARQACQNRGLALALGGIYDHVGGGFHRYTVDPTWTVPHFEKMLYDNGQNIEFLANLWSAGITEPAFARSIAGTVQWLKREMRAPEGYFYAAQDADSFLTPEEAEPEEGAFYVWRYEDLAQILTPDELTELSAHFTVTPQGNFEGKNVLQRQQPGELPASLEAILDKLFVVRYGELLDETGATFPPARDNQEAKTHAWPGRIPAVTDTKMIVAWNSLMISGLARSAAVLQQANYLELAVSAAQFILEQQWVNDRLHRLNYQGQPRVIAQSEDYALLIKALLDLHQADTQPANHQPDRPAVWLERAIQLQAEFDRHLWSAELGGYFNTDERNDLVIRERHYEDNATPSANGVAAANLMRLFLATEDLAYLDRAERTLKAFSAVMQQAPHACPGLFTALDWFQFPLLVRTPPNLIPQLITHYHPTTHYRCTTDLPPDTIGLVCQGLTCREPAPSFDRMLAQIQQFER